MQVSVRNNWHIVTALAVIAFCLRLIITGIPPYEDEANTLHFIEEFGTVELLWQLPMHQPHMPLFYVAGDLVGLLTGDPAHVRALSLLAGCLVPVAAYLWFRTLVGEQRSLYVALLLCSSPLLVVQSRWIRPYAVFTLAVFVSWWAAWRWIDGGPAWPYFAAAVTSVLLHPFGAVSVAAQISWVVLERRLTGRTWDWQTAVAGSAIGAVVPSVVGIQAFVYDAFGSAVELGHVSPADTPSLRLLLLPMTTLTGTLYFASHLLLLSGVSLFYIYRASRVRLWTSQPGRLCCFWVGGSLAALVAVQVIFPVMMLKYLGWIAPGVALAIIQLTPKTRVGRAVLGILVAVIVVNLFLGLSATATVSRITHISNGVLRNI